MSTIDFIRGGLRQLHGSYDEAISDLTDEQLHWRANEHGLPISFIVWHYVRTEDNVVNFVLQLKPTIWLDGSWNERFGLEKTSQGTGMSLQDAQNLRVDSLDDWRRCQSGVWAGTDAFLAAANDEMLQEMVPSSRSARCRSRTPLV
jgi:hypothetical protein